MRVGGADNARGFKMVPLLLVQTRNPSSPPPQLKNPVFIPSMHGNVAIGMFPWDVSMGMLHAIYKLIVALKY